MTPLEDRVREALAGKAREFPPDAVPPLRLPARRRRFFSLAYGGGERKEAPGSRGWLAPVAAAVMVAAVIAGSVAVSHVVQQRRGAASSLDAAADAAAARSNAASWVAAQVSRSTMVSCDPVMCRAIASRGFPSAYLDEVLPGKIYIWASGVVVATAAVRRDFHGTLSSSYAPGIIASFGSGASQVDVRVVDPGGSASYKAAVSADLQARKVTGAQLANNPGIDASVVARRQLRAGRVDSRVMTILAGLAATHPLLVLAFGDSGPGAGATSPLRSVELALASQVAGAGRPGSRQEIMAVLDAQQAPFHPARIALIRLADGRAAVRVEFTAPSPLGLLASGQRTGS
jgi:hypothetical protein